MFLASVEECRAELDRETKLVPQEGSEKIIKEHRVRPTHLSAAPRSHNVPSSIDLILSFGSENTQ